ncbi:MAG: efflux RND transporter periplasmic adaptor subunit [Elainellaceae cyanobacterium]
MTNPKHNKKKKPIGQMLIGFSGLLALIALTGVGIYWKTLHSSADPVLVRFIEAERDTLEITLNEGGIVKLGNQQTLKSPSEGAVEEVLVRPGDRVTAGQVLMTLRNPTRQTALAMQQVKIQQQQALIRRGRQRVEETKNQLAADVEELENLEQLAADGAIARSEVNTQADAVRQGRVAMRDAEAESTSAQLTLQELQLERQRIEGELDDTLITAPISGTILDVPVKAGDGVEIRTDLLTLGDSTQEVIELELSTLNAKGVQLNQQARISVIGPDPQIYQGRVVALYPQAIVSNDASGGGNGSDAGQPRVPTLIRLDRPTQSLIPGSQVNVEIILEQRQNIIVIDVEALQNQPSQSFVWRVDDTGDAYQQPVKTGLEALTQVEIVDGLSAGDRIIVPPLDMPLEEGDAVILDETNTPNTSEE